MPSHVEIQDEAAIPLWDRSALTGKEKSNGIILHVLLWLAYFVFEINHIIVCMNNSFLYMNGEYSIS